MGSAMASADRRVHDLQRQGLPPRPQRGADDARRNRDIDGGKAQMNRTGSVLIAVTLLVGFAAAQSVEKIDYVTIGKIRDEGMNRSQVMDHVSWLADVYGPRTTGSPAIQQ